MGLSGFYRCLIQGYASLAAPLTALLTKESFLWTIAANQAFLKLKEALCKALVLGIGMGVILSQRHHPIAYFSKPFCSKLLRASTYVRELAAITIAVKKWHQYLLGHHFTILTDHRSLKELMAQAIQTHVQQTYLAQLLGYDYTIQYRAGKANAAADALSKRLEPPSGEFFILTIPNCDFL